MGGGGWVGLTGDKWKPMLGVPTGRHTGFTEQLERKTPEQAQFFIPGASA